METLNDGWQIGFTTPRGDIAPREIADQIAQQIGWEITEEIDKDAGCYMTSIRERDVQELIDTGWLDFSTEFGRAVAEADIDHIEQIS